MNKGDKVVVVKSPYKSVKRGTVTTIADCYEHMFGTRCNMYALEGIPMKYFREHEIALIQEKETDENIQATS